MNEHTTHKIPGFSFSSVASGIKAGNEYDLGLIVSHVDAQVCGLFTTNKVKSAPVLLSMERVQNRFGRAIIANSGNANACTGDAGIEDANKIGKLIAHCLNIDEHMVLLASTGVIGVPLPFKKIETAIPNLISSLSEEGLHTFAHAIMTTDTFPKVSVKKCTLSGKEVTIGGIAKGSGMIMPHLATMLAFVVTDISIEHELLQRAFVSSVHKSLNCITVDGQTSTSDTALIMANGVA
ncbi:MAG: bifunctional ornithine acetyltransferase/N-acetylglutamate synthase, partial [Thermodesulfobacteriota bacterium]|nr:bifunctional ornithine acetyltransferase/N-acetylglutamate synthase [Thermodesulfobacteriota bacterium]